MRDRAALAFVGSIAVLPFLFPTHHAPLTAFYNEWIALALGTAAFFALTSSDFWRYPQVPRTAVFLSAFVVLLAIQGLLKPYSYLAQALIPALYVTWAIVLMVVTSWLRERIGIDGVSVILAWFILVGGLVHALTGLVQYIGFGGWLGGFVPIKIGGAIYGNVVQANHFATHLTLAVVALSYLYSQRRLSLTFVLAFSSYLAFFVTLSGSRAVLLYAIALVLFSLFAYVKQRQPEQLKLFTATGSFLLAFVCFQYLVDVINPIVARNLADLSLNADPFSLVTALGKLPATPLGLELRLSEWHKALLMFLEAPGLGVGVGNYGWHSFQYQSLSQFSGTLKPQLFAHSHNLFAQVAAETGIVGIALLVGLMVAWVAQFKNRWLSPSGWFICGILVVLFIHSNLEYPLWYSYFLGIAAVGLALGDERLVPIRFSPTLGRVGTSVTLLLVASILVVNLLSFRALANIAEQFVRSDRLTQQEHVNKLIGMTKNALLAPYAELVLFAMMPTDKDQIEEKIVVSTRQFLRNPDPYKAYKQVAFLALAGRPDEAGALLKQVAAAYPDKLPLFVSFLQRSPEPELGEIAIDATALKARFDLNVQPE